MPLRVGVGDVDETLFHEGISSLSDEWYLGEQKNPSVRTG
jgi:hypothetical protein